MIRGWPLLFILIPLVELYVIIVVGEQIGALWTVLLVIFTAVVGVNLLRIQGMSTLARAQRNMAQGQIPAMEMMEGVALAVAGVLLITPGFITDTLGFLCLFPATRQAMIRFLMSRATVVGFGGYQQHGRPESNAWEGEARPEDEDAPGVEHTRVGRTIEGEYRRED